MSHQQRIHFLHELHDAISAYQGFTLQEKQYTLQHLNTWVGKHGNLELLIQKFSELSLDLRPFLVDKHFLKA